VKNWESPGFIITIGASAGGLNAINEVVSQLPEDLNAAVFVVIHLAKVGLGNFLLTRLQKYTSFHCVLAEEGQEIERGHIYIAPPGVHLLIKDGKIGLGHGPAENRWRPSIDVLFRSAAAHFGDRTIGIILTGYLNDGTAGMSAIKRCNGYCIVQDPAQAEYPDMPQSVLDSVPVDFCVPLIKIVGSILSIIKSAEPAPASVPPDVAKEAKIAENAVVSLEAAANLGEKAPYVCPDCGGSLWSMNTGDIKRYRCYVGHSYYENELLIKQAESLEATLWIALRMMEERRMLLLKIYDDELKKGFHRLAQIHKKRADDLEKHISKLKDLLFTSQKL
jgi:two-component system chemotaxis response regulator CheB